MKRLFYIIMCLLALFAMQQISAQEQVEEKIVVVVTDDGVLFNGEATTLEAVPEQFWQALQRNPKIKYYISAKSNNAATIERMQQLSKSIMEYLQQQQLGVGETTAKENVLRIDVKSDELVVRLGSGDAHLLNVKEIDRLRELVVDFISCREVGEKHLFRLADGTEFEHTPNDATVVMLAKEGGAEIDSVMQVVTQTIAEGFDFRRSELSEQVLQLPYHELDNVSRSVFMAAVPKRTQSNVASVKVVREVKPQENDNKKALELMGKCLLKADGTFAWEGKSYKMEEIVDVLGVDFDTSKFMLDDPLVSMIMEKAFGNRAPKLNDIDIYSLSKLLGFSMPNVMGGFVNMMAHSVKVIKENPELVDAYVPLSISGLDFVALDAAGGEVQQMAQAEKLQVKFTIVGNESCRSGVKKLTVSVFELASGQELKQQYSVDYQNVDLPVVVPFDLTTQLGKGTYFISVHRGKQPLGIIEVEMAQ